MTMSAKLVEEIKERLSDFAKDYREIGNCMSLLLDMADSKKPYAYAVEALTIYRHDALQLYTRTPRTYFHVENVDEDLPMNIDDLYDMCKSSLMAIMGYDKDRNRGRITDGANVDKEGWNVEMISLYQNGKSYPMQFIVYFLDYSNPQKDYDYTLDMEQVNEIINESHR